MRPPDVEQQSLFAAGTGGYHSYRIPALLATTSGRLLAFCEARRHSRADSGDIDIALRCSDDGGLTWDAMRIIADAGADVLGNPCPVQDRATGRIWLPLNWNLAAGDESLILRDEAPRDVRLMVSDDDGVNWSAPADITAQVKRPDWTWYATGPGHGIQLRTGRLLIPCDHAVTAADPTPAHYGSHVIVSDDHGATWRVGGVLSGHVNECQAAELADGTLYLNMRSYHGKGCRAVAWSTDGGETWSPVTWDSALVEPVCQAGLLGLSDGRVLFANPASERRENLTVRMSRDGCHTWPAALTLHPGPAAYSDLAQAGDAAILCLYERGRGHPYEEIALARFGPEEWVSI